MITYKTFTDTALFEALTNTLDKHGIVYQTEQAPMDVNPLTAINTEISTEYSVKIAPADFDRMNDILNDEEDAEIAVVANDHYLFAFTNDELIELISKADEWSAFDYKLAQAILKQRGVGLDNTALKEIRAHRIAELSKPEPSQTLWIIIGYITAILGGVLGIFIGWHLSRHKKTLSNGESVFAYNEDDRKQGVRIFCLSILMFALSILYRLFLT